MGPELSDPIINLTPRSEWKTPANSQDALIDKMRQRLEASLPGVGFNFTQPIALRVDELISGVKSQVAVKIFGEDLGILKTKAEEIAKNVIRHEGNGRPQGRAGFRPAISPHRIRSAGARAIRD